MSGLVVIVKREREYFVTDTVPAILVVKQAGSYSDQTTPRQVISTYKSELIIYSFN